VESAVTWLLSVAAWFIDQLQLQLLNIILGRLIQELVAGQQAEGEQDDDNGQPAQCGAVEASEARLAVEPKLEEAQTGGTIGLCAFYGHCVFFFTFFFIDSVLGVVHKIYLSIVNYNIGLYSPALERGGNLR
jgi:hypothetical protein